VFSKGGFRIEGDRTFRKGRRPLDPEPGKGESSKKKLWRGAGLYRRGNLLISGRQKRGKKEKYIREEKRGGSGQGGGGLSS